jgi:hypothetical protein
LIKRRNPETRQKAHSLLASRHTAVTFVCSTACPWDERIVLISHTETRGSSFTQLPRPHTRGYKASEFCRMAKLRPKKEVPSISLYLLRSPLTTPYWRKDILQHTPPSIPSQGKQVSYGSALWILATADPKLGYVPRRCLLTEGARHLQVCNVVRGADTVHGAPRCEPNQKNVFHCQSRRFDLHTHYKSESKTHAKGKWPCYKGRRRIEVVPSR